MSARVLVIEDEARLADFLVRGLEEEGYRVDHQPDGETGWLALETQRWDLVLLDWSLPGENGIDLLRRFRRHDRSTPVLFLTARDAVTDRVDGLDAGADDYLTKPFSFEELLARIRALLRRGQAGGTELTAADVVVDLAAQKATRAGQPLGLTAKELSLLVMFMRRPGVVFSRTRIYEAVWGDRFDGLSNTIEVHIKELRRKLEAHGPRLIHTRRGRGYVFEATPDEEGAT